MKNFDPTGFIRQKWSDPKNVKNRPHTCDKSHSFCNLQYQWATQGTKMKPINRPINSSLPNIDLPMPSQKFISVNYDSITEQNLDDWIAQSINRNLASMLNPQKKFFLPPQLQQDLKQRYRKNKDLKKVTEGQTYFLPNGETKKLKGYLSNDRKKKLSVNQLCFDYKKLQPHQQMIGTPIKIRQMKKIQKKQIRRRHAILLSNDIHYQRFLRQQQKTQVPHSISQQKQETAVTLTKQKIYSYNIQSMNRKSCYDNVPCSLIEHQIDKKKDIDRDLLTSHRALMTKQDELHEKYRVMMNQKTDNAISQIKQMAKNAKQTVNLQNSHISNAIFKKHASQGYNQNRITSNEIQAKDKKYLQNKVIRLLNDMQVQSQPIDQDMAKLNIHVNEIFLQHPDGRPQTKWILKAQQKIKDGKNLLAIDCYKQAIILQPELFIPVFNIAVLLQKQNMLQSANLWFNVARQFQTDSQNVLFGISLVALKQLRYNECLNVVNQLFHKLESSGKPINSIYYYIRALCNKQLNNHKDAKSDYNHITAQMKPTNFNVLPNFLFSVVFGRQRRIHLQFNCLSYMLFRQALFIILYENQKKIKQNTQSLGSIAEKIAAGPFFNRFSLNLIRKLLKIAKYDEKQKGQIIFSSKNQTSIIINGIVSLNSHEKQFNKPQMISILGKGGIIGSGSLQNNLSSKPNNWFIAKSKVQLITVPRYDFELFWKGQITFQVDFKYNFLKNVELFKGLSENTLFKLCEFFQQKVYSKGQILFNDCSYRTEMLSKPGKGYGLAKAHKADIRMVHSNQVETKTGQRRERTKIWHILKKHIFKFNQMKFNRTKYPGLFVITKGTVQLEDDRGFRCNGMIGERDYFGQILLIDADGYHNYGRMVAESQDLHVLLLNIDKMVWLFNNIDKDIMAKNCKNRETIQTVRFLRNRFIQCQNTKMYIKQRS